MLDWKDCPNCGATLEASKLVCDRCGERSDDPGSGQPRFSPEARDTGIGLGGLLKLYATTDPIVPYIGWGPAGAFGVSAAGDLIWVEDWGYLPKVEVNEAELRLNGKVADIRTGKLRS